MITIAPTYITGLGSFFPGPPVANDGIAARLGIRDRRALQIGRKALRQNGIRTRHYALDDDGRALFTNAEMAAAASRTALGAAGLTPGDVDMIAAASSAGDLIAPGFGSAVHGELGGGPAEVASFTSFCASGMMALKAAMTTIAVRGARRAVVCASEFASRFLREGYLAGARRDLSTEFLRWMLSDGAGAAVLEAEPRRSGLSLRIDWIDIRSYADRMPYCMTGGGTRRPDGGWNPWANAPTLRDAVEDGAFHLRQDLKLLDQIVPLGLNRYMELVEAGRIDPAGVDWAIYHFSSDVFRRRMVDAAGAGAIPINANRVFTNLFDRGNVGSASVFVMLDDLVASGRARPGQRILCMVPESGRFLYAFMMLTVVGTPDETREPAPPSRTIGTPPIPDPAIPEPVEVTPGEPARPHADGPLMTDLARVWAAFEADLATVPIVRRLNDGRLTLADYRALLVNLRQQVVDGSRWIARAASNIALDDVTLRTAFLRHAADEHRDYTLLEADYVACGGTLAAIRSARKNAGSEALSAWMFQRAGRENPFDLLGAMFVIEGLGSRLAGRWARRIRAQLSLGEDKVRFLAHHGTADQAHMARFSEALAAVVAAGQDPAEIVRTARVTARLYRLQLEEIAPC